jgi:glycosyltransferase involved in cell wall biosynthesis
MKILFLPSHYVLDDHQYGSEADEAYSIVNGVGSKYPESLAITGRKNLKNVPIYRVVEVYPKFKDFNMTFLSSIVFAVRYTIGGMKILRKEKFDVIHHIRPFALDMTFNLPVLLGASRNTPFVIGEICSPYKTKGAKNHEKEPNLKDVLVGFIERALVFVLYPLSRATLRKADTIFVLDSHTKENVLERAPNANIILLPLGKEASKYSFDSFKKFEKGKLTFVSVGNFVPRKGYDMLIEAFSAVATKYPNARLKLVGNGYEEAKLKDLVKRLDIPEQVIFTGRVENSQIPKVYAESDVYVAMPTEEAFGHVYIEAIATGLPIIATETVGSNEIMKNKNIGTIIPQADTSAMASQMERFLANPSLLKQLSSNARKEFERRYDLNVIIPRYIAEYKRLIKARSHTQTVLSSNVADAI